MKISTAPFLKGLPGPRTGSWPDGEPFAELLRHGTMRVEVFAPQGQDSQTPHEQDELYFVFHGSARFVREGRSCDVAAGDVLFVPAHAEHHFEAMSADFATWVVFWGPAGGERDRP